MYIQKTNAKKNKAYQRLQKKRKGNKQREKKLITKIQRALCKEVQSISKITKEKKKQQTERKETNYKEIES